ncbi:RNA polymerase sigma factor [Sphingomonas sp. CFBP 13603]|uniref:RNA polymerase sigma factor n=1 Tax=Sphingomonas sp. CFBP 13603 TaxID=2774040 RepID=UPI0018676577|nr:RNA polymerase sigma factor [Sphingomonas sp. CFBP 13603]MBE2993006.1 RNA polymerase sigma factor [Sphingomonas sp. CFBP 13603]
MSGKTAPIARNRNPLSADLASDLSGSGDLDALYREEAPRLARYFRRHARQTDEVPDLVQETFARLIAAKASETCRRPAAYLQRMARNLLIDQSRRPHTRLARFHVSIDDQCEVTGQPEQGHAIEADDALRMYGQVLAALPDRTRHVFTLHRVDGLGYKAIGEQLGISVPTVQYHVARALMQLDKAFDRG